MRADLRLCLVTDPVLCAGIGVPATVAAAVSGGATMIQLRDLVASDREVHDLACRLASELAGSGVALIVDNRLDLALAAGADGVHLGEADLPARAARSVAGEDALIGLSVGDPQAAAEAQALPPGTVDYLGVGPVFATSTKHDASRPIGPRGLARCCAATSIPCVAIGGIEESRVGEVLAAGARGVAVVSAVCGRPDPEASCRELRAAVDRALAGETA